MHIKAALLPVENYKISIWQLLWGQNTQFHPKQQKRTRRSLGLFDWLLQYLAFSVLSRIKNASRRKALCPVLFTGRFLHWPYGTVCQLCSRAVQSTCSPALCCSPQPQNCCKLSLRVPEQPPASCPAMAMKSNCKALACRHLLNRGC